MEGSVKDPAKKRPRGVISIVILAIIVVIVVAASMLVFMAPLATVQLVVLNEGQWSSQRVHVGIYLDGQVSEIVYIEAGSSYYDDFRLTRGTHSIGFDFSYSSFADIDGVVDLLYSFDVEFLSSQGLMYTLRP